MPASVVSIGTALPDVRVAQQDVKEAVRRMFGSVVPHLDRLLTVFDHSGIETRHFCAPLDWFLVPHSVEEKHRRFVAHATELSERAVRQCLSRAGATPADVDHILFVTTTGTATPSIDAHLCGRLGFRPNVKRTPIWGLGCAGGAAGLSRAAEYVRAFPDHRCLLVAAELCSLTFLRDDASKSNIVATSLFADGAAAALIADPTRGAPVDPESTSPSIVATESTIWPDSLDVMGWDVTNEGLKVVFSKDIPTLVTNAMRGVVESLLRPQGVRLEQLESFALHPGGMKVLRAYETALGLPPDALSASAQVLRDCGNMSSCTVLFVLERAMRRGAAPAGSFALAGALGPGFSAELALLRF